MFSGSYPAKSTLQEIYLLENTLFDTLDFDSQQICLGGRLAIDATTKIGPEKILIGVNHL